MEDAHCPKIDDFEVEPRLDLPIEPSQLSLYRLIFPQMTLWLRSAQYRLAFEAEMERFVAPQILLF